MADQILPNKQENKSERELESIHFDDAVNLEIIALDPMLKQPKNSLRLYSLDRRNTLRGRVVWESIKIDYPITIEMTAMYPGLKKAVMDDLDKFLKWREFYGRVGKVWKREYLIYGPPNTGKTSLIFAIASYLKFDIYELQLTGLRDELELRQLLVSTSKRLVLLIKDLAIRRSDYESLYSSARYTINVLSWLNNILEGTWSSCLDERIIVFTSDQLPFGFVNDRLDMCIQMTYCTPCMFKFLASNYLKIENHPLFEKIERMLEDHAITPRILINMLMYSNDVEVTLGNLTSYLEYLYDLEERKEKWELGKIEELKAKAEKEKAASDQVKTNNRRIEEAKTRPQCGSCIIL